MSDENATTAAAGTPATGREFPEGSTIVSPLTFVLESRSSDGQYVDQYLVRAPWETEAKWVTVPDPFGVVVSLPPILPGPGNPPPIVDPPEEPVEPTEPDPGSDGADG